MSRLTFESRARAEKQSDPVGRSLVDFALAAPHAIVLQFSPALQRDPACRLLIKWVRCILKLFEKYCPNTLCMKIIKFVLFSGEEKLRYVACNCWYLFGFLQWERQRRLRYLIIKCIEILLNSEEREIPSNGICLFFAVVIRVGGNALLWSFANGGREQIGQVVTIFGMR